MLNCCLSIISIFVLLFSAAGFASAQTQTVSKQPRARIKKTVKTYPKRVQTARRPTPEIIAQPQNEQSEPTIVTRENPTPAASENSVREAKTEIAFEPFKETESKFEPEAAIPPVSTSNATGYAPIFRVGIAGGQSNTLTLNEAIRKALENNNDIEIARNDVRINEATLKSLQGIYDGTFNFTPTYARNSSTGSRATNDFRAQSNFSQFIRRGGGNYQAFFNNNRTENAFQQATLSNGNVSGSNSAIYSASLGFTYTQPLWRGRKTDNNRRQIKIQRKRLEQSDAEFRRRTIDIISQVQRAYWDLVFALRDQQNRVANLNLSKENLRQVEAKIAAGSAAPLNRAEVEVELANREADVLLAAQQVSLAENALKNLLIKNADSAEWQMPIVPTDQPIFDTTPVSLDDAIKEAQANRPELRRLNLQKEINKIDIDFFKNQTKPQIDLVSSFSLDGLSRAAVANPITSVPQFSGNDEILRQKLNTLLSPANQILNPLIPVEQPPAFLIGGYNQAFRNIFRSDAPNFSVGVSISFPLRNTTAKANLEGAKYTQTQLDAQTRQQEQGIILEVRNAVQAVETARQRVLTARRAREFAETQLKGEQKLFEVGRSTTFLLFQRENALTNARNAEIRAETDYNKALADLQRATSTTLQTYNIVIE